MARTRIDAARARRNVWRAAVALAILAALVSGGRQLAALVPALARWVAGMGVWAPVAFIVTYAVATVAFVPGSVLTLAAGALFGIVRGTAYVALGATLGEAGAFLIARHFARRFVARRIAGSPRFSALDAALGREGWRVVLLLRLSPVVPFNLLNYALGITRVSFRDFFIASVGILPGTLLYVYYGQVAGEVATVAGGGAPARGIGYYMLLAAGLAATVTATVLISRAARRALAHSTRGTLS